jgi:hypothetical protein
MENNKDIGKAFRDKLDGLQKQPCTAVWDAIKKDLPKKKPGFLLLFWSEASNTLKTVIVTLLTVLFLISGFFFIESKENDGTINSTKIITQGKSNSTKGSSINTTTKHSIDSKVNDGGTKAGKDLNSINNTSQPFKDGKLPENSYGNNVKGVNTLRTNKKNSRPSQLYNGTSQDGYKNRSHGLSTKFDTAPDKRSTSKGSRTKKNKSWNANSIKTHTAQSNSATNRNLQLNNGNSRSGNRKNNNGGLSKITSTATNTGSTNTNVGFSGNIDVTNPGTSTTNGSNSNGPGLNRTTSEIALVLTDTVSQICDSLSDIALQEDLIFCKDTVETNSIKSNEADAKNIKRFHIFAYAAPTSFKLKNNIIQDSTLAGNTTTTKVDYNYGAYIGYNFNEKWSVRAGINLTGLQHTTKNAFIQNTYAVVPGTENNPANYVHVFAPQNYTGINYTRNGSNAAVVQNLGNPDGQATVNIIQKVEFVEVPVEVSYKLFGNKLGAGISGGLSTIFTTKNIVYAQNDNGTLWLGNNKHIKDIGLATMIGLHLYYRPLPYLQINSEPVFKYYLNTFNNSQPYSFGIQAGLQFNFDLFKSKK